MKWTVLNVQDEVPQLVAHPGLLESILMIDVPKFAIAYYMYSYSVNFCSAI